MHHDCGAVSQYVHIAVVVTVPSRGSRYIALNAVLGQRAGSARTLDPIRTSRDAGNLEYRAEYHDKLVKAMHEERHTVSGYRTLPERGRFAFKVDPQHGPQPWLDRDNPIVAYHPVYLFEANEPSI